MRPEPNNDIDLLLRQLSRRNGTPVSEIDEAHLDADELNSYVANALPAATRARYTAHLADCSSCRKLVVDLSAAQGPVTVQQSGPAVAPSRLMSFLASLFSPMVLRYAVPALGLMVIAVIGIVVLRRDGSKAPFAQNDSTAGQVANMPQVSPSSGYYDSASPGRTEGTKQQPAAAAAKEEIAKAAPVTKAPEPAANQAGDAAGTVAAEAPPPPKAVPAEEEERQRVAKLQDEKKAEAAQPAAARDVNKEREADKNEPAKQKTDNVSSLTVAPNTTTRKDIAVRPAKSADTANAGAGAGQELRRSPTGKLQAQSRAEGRGADADDKAVETRSVAGRRFRKSGRVWIDTAFDSSKPIISVTRGSEHYRSLVGDEPSLRKIADELDGEIVVVWKGSTYRIR